MNPYGRVLILGGSSGIGAALARRLTAADARVAIAGRNTERLDAVGEECGFIPAFSVDATDPTSVAECVESAATALEGFDGVVNCVGNILLKNALQTSDDEWRKTITTNLDSSFWIVREAVKRMKGTGGSIVLMTTAVALHGFAAHEAIAAAKAGVIGLARSAAASFASAGVRVNCVAPGLTETPLSEPLMHSDVARRASLSMHPDGRAGTADEVASAIAFLLHRDQSHVTGNVLHVDGGLGNLRSR